MHLDRETTRANVFSALEASRVRIGERWVASNVIVTADSIYEPWAVGAAQDIKAADLEWAVARRPQIILLGTGDQQVLPDVHLIGELAGLGIGLEVMTTAAACRTFNVLINEARAVAAALLIDPG